MTSILTNAGIEMIIDRAYNSSTTKTTVSQYSIGTDQTNTPTVESTNLDVKIPISNGTVNDDGDNQLTGSSGGDNSTDNTTTFKPGAGLTDVTAQNLIANNTNVTKIWTISDLSSLGTIITGTEPFGLWFYINDAADLAKFKTSGTALEIKLGSDSSNYFSLTKTASDLAIGWNWITSNLVNVNALTETNTVTGDIDTFIIEVITNNSTDTFIAGDVIYDLLRQWSTSDLVKNTTSTTIDTTAKTVEIRGDLLSTQANGFNIDSFQTQNTDSPVLVEGIDTFSSESKSNTDEFIFFAKNKFINTDV